MKRFFRHSAVLAVTAVMLPLAACQSVQSTKAPAIFEVSSSDPTDARLQTLQDDLTQLGFTIEKQVQPGTDTSDSPSITASLSGPSALAYANCPDAEPTPIDDHDKRFAFARVEEVRIGLDAMVEPREQGSSTMFTIKYHGRYHNPFINEEFYQPCTGNGKLESQLRSLQ